MYIKQLYSRYAYIAFRENVHVSMEARLMLNKVCKTLCVVVKIIKKKTNAQSRMFIFSCAYANMTALVTPRLFLTFMEEYPVSLCDINF